MDYSETESKFLKKFYIQQRFLELVKSGQKTAEARPSHEVENLRLGQEFELCSSSENILVRVKSIETYNNIQYLTETANLSSIVPGITKEAAAAEWKKLYPRHSGKISIINFELVAK